MPETPNQYWDAHRNNETGTVRIVCRGQAIVLNDDDAHRLLNDLRQLLSPPRATKRGTEIY